MIYCNFRFSTSRIHRWLISTTYSLSGKIFLLFYSVFVISTLLSCSRIQVQSDLPSATQLNVGYHKLVIIPVNDDDREFADCLAETLQNELDYLEFTDDTIFRDVLFPWFEPFNRATDTKELVSFTHKPLVRDKLRSLGIELLIYVEGRTRWDQLDGSGGCLAGPGAAGCFGYISTDRETVISTTLVDLQKSEFLGGAQIVSKGYLAVPMIILPIPIPIGLYTETSACEKTALNIANSLTSK